VIRLRNHPRGYGLVTKVLHWATALLLLAQFLVGYSMERFDALLEWAVDRWLGGEADLLLPVHVALGVSILVLAVVRLLWRKAAGLPDWAEGLSTVERRIAHVTMVLKHQFVDRDRLLNRML
jgi:cytochrome b561